MTPSRNNGGVEVVEVKEAIAKPIIEMIDPTDDNTFVIDTLQKAEWAAGVVNDKRNQLARIQAQAKAMISSAKAEVARAEEWFLPQIELVAKTVLAVQNKDSKKPSKTLKTFHGNMAFRSLPHQFQMFDFDLLDEGERAIEVLKEHPQLHKCLTVTIKLPYWKYLELTGVDKVLLDTKYSVDERRLFEEITVDEERVKTANKETGEVRVETKTKLTVGDVDVSSIVKYIPARESFSLSNPTPRGGD